MGLRNLVFISLFIYNFANAQDEILKIPADNKFYEVELTGDNIEELVKISEEFIEIYSRKVAFFSKEESYSKVSQFFIPPDIRNKLNGAVVKKNPETNLNEIVLDIKGIYEAPAVIWNGEKFQIVPYDHSMD